MGKFNDDVVVRWLKQEGDDRDMELIRDFVYIDDNNISWSVPAGAVVNGASIPQVFWSSFGSPFIGDYRRASVIHDYYCQTRSRPSDDVHDMFYAACVDGSVSIIRAKAMYLAIISFGPHWTVVPRDMKILTRQFSSGDKFDYVSTMNSVQYNKINKWVESDNPTLLEIKSAVARQGLVAIGIRNSTSLIQ